MTCTIKKYNAEVTISNTKEEKQNGDDIFIGIMSKNFSEANETPSSHCLIILV
jgi:hypothetical protein